MAAQTIEVPDDAQLTQYGEAIGGSPGFHNRLRAEVGETEVSLMLGRVDPLAAAMLVTRSPNTFAVVRHCTAGLGIWDWASTDRGSEPDVVMACCGDVPTLETLAAVDLLRQGCLRRGCCHVEQ